MIGSITTTDTSVWTDTPGPLRCTAVVGTLPLLSSCTHVALLDTVGHDHPMFREGLHENPVQFFRRELQFSITGAISHWLQFQSQIANETKVEREMLCTPTWRLAFTSTYELLSNVRIFKCPVVDRIINSFIEKYTTRGCHKSTHASHFPRCHILAKNNRHNSWNDPRILIRMNSFEILLLQQK
jgi:hypothetical protein